MRGILSTVTWQYSSVNPVTHSILRVVRANKLVYSCRQCMTSLLKICTLSKNDHLYHRTILLAKNDIIHGRWKKASKMSHTVFVAALQWRHIERDDVLNHRRHDCLLNRLFMRRSKKISKLRVTGPLSGEFTSAQRISNTESVSIWWRHHGLVEIWV